VQARQVSLGGGGGFFLMGHSAGAYNAVMLGLDPGWLRAAGGDDARVDGVVALAGPYDFVPANTPDVAASFPDGGLATQPVHFVRAGAPPLLLLAGTGDTTVKPRNSVLLAARQQAAGGQVDLKMIPEIGHVGLILALTPLFRWRAPVLHDVTMFIHEHASADTRGVRKPSATAPQGSA
jgi:acetyl esterase/lipase